MSVGENIRTRRLDLGMTQEELGSAVEVGRSMIAQYERGSKVPNLIIGRSIARVFKCSMEELFEEV